VRVRARIGLPALALLAGGVAGVLPALAADQEVLAQDDRFNPSTVTVAPGDTVTIRHAGVNEHALKFDDEQYYRRTGGRGWVETRTFTAAEARDAPYRFVCDLHLGMTGQVYVRAATTTSPTPTATASPSPTPDPGPGEPPPPGGEPQPALRSATMTRRRFCTRRSDECRRPGVRLRVELDRDAEVLATVTKRRDGRYRRFGTVDFGERDAGTHALRFRRTEAGRLLRPGRYRLTLRVGDRTMTFSFRVVRR
jgi:plastocyanin